MTMASGIFLYNPESEEKDLGLEGEAEAIPEPDIALDGHEEENSLSQLQSTANFFQIRNRFEERSKRGMKHNDSPSPVPLKDQYLTDSKEESEPEFQNLYPFFKEYFSKRQFASIERCFKEWDANNDGFLEAKEVKQMLAEHQHKINLCDADLIVNVGDEDHDGKLSPKEFLELCKPTAESIRQQQHMEGSYPPSDKEFIALIVQKLLEFVNPVKGTANVKGTKQFFENMISAGNKVVPSKGQHIPLRRRPTEKGNTNSQENPEGFSFHPTISDLKEALFPVPPVPLPRHNAPKK